MFNYWDKQRGFDNFMNTMMDDQPWVSIAIDKARDEVVVVVVLIFPAFTDDLLVLILLLCCRYLVLSLDAFDLAKIELDGSSTVKSDESHDD